VLDLAAGTGQLSRLLRTRVRRTIAVEPVPAMRAKIAAVLPDVAVLDGTAEAIPLRDRERRRVAGRVRAHPPVRRPRARRAHARPEARSGRLRGTGRLVELDREPPERAAQDVLEEVHALVQGHDAIVIPYRTDLYVARRRAS
jgi:hypothetical protein